MEQTPPQMTTIKVAQTKQLEENQVRQVMQNIFDAVRLRDVKSILSHYDEDAVIYDVNDTLQRDKDGLRKAWQECFDTSSEFLLEPLDLKIDVDMNSAMVHGLVHSLGLTTEGEHVEVWMRLTSYLRKFNDKWLIIHEHISVPGDFMTGRILQDLQPKRLN